MLTLDKSELHQSDADLARPHLDGAVQRCARERVGVLGVEHHLCTTAQRISHGEDALAQLFAARICKLVHSCWQVQASEQG